MARNDEDIRDEIDQDSLVALSRTGYFKRKADELVLQGINGMPTHPREIELWAIKLAAERDLLLRLQQEADSVARDIVRAEEDGDSDV